MALALAVRHPERVRAADPRRHPRRRRRARRARRARRGDRSRCGPAAAPSTSPGCCRAWWRTRRRRTSATSWPRARRVRRTPRSSDALDALAGRPDRRAELAGIGRPTLVVVGRRGRGDPARRGPRTRGRHRRRPAGRDSGVRATCPRSSDRSRSPGPSAHFLDGLPRAPLSSPYTVGGLTGHSRPNKLTGETPFLSPAISEVWHECRPFLPQLTSMCATVDAVSSSSGCTTSTTMGARCWTRCRSFRSASSGSSPPTCAATASRRRRRARGASTTLRPTSPASSPPKVRRRSSSAKASAPRRRSRLRSGTRAWSAASS